ncbi:MAG: cytochrome d ubiquinol oxidase subunit II [Opitutaceae bacterium]|jgi:cytochrome d ubiquinol oxidase subunit II|nr:cytochrome d ubiquinol oxidase subunit II [Opitutaceae bacterium]
MTHILIFFIGASLLLYTLLGGSDYGAGIIELLPSGALRDRQKRVVNEAMGPVWEANHIWLILIVVILFNGFPPIFTTLMTALHVPMLALLAGIVVRGSVFTFRHYDAVQAEKSQRVYTLLFGCSSLWTAFWLGIIVASLNRGLIDTSAPDAYAAYIAPWVGWYPLAVGFFVACIFLFLAGIYLIGETDDDALRSHFSRIAATANVLVIASGGLVFAASLLEKENLLSVFFHHPPALLALGLAALLFVALWVAARNRGARQALVIRVIAGGQVTLILLGWWLLYAPNAMLTAGGPLNFYAEVAPASTQRQLVIALLVGSLIIFPSLFFLLRVFKARAR